MSKRIVSACVIAAMAVLGLTACSNPAESLLERVIEDQFGGGFGVDLEGGGLSIGGEEGGLQLGPAAKVPEGFPSSIALPSTGLIAAGAVSGGAR